MNTNPWNGWKLVLTAESSSKCEVTGETSDLTDIYEIPVSKLRVGESVMWEKGGVHNMYMSKGRQLVCTAIDPSGITLKPGAWPEFTLQRTYGASHEHRYSFGEWSYSDLFTLVK